MRAYSSPIYEELYSQLLIEEYLESLRDKGIGKYRCKTTVSGKMMEIELYSLPKNRKGKRAKQEKPSRPAQRNLNDSNARKLITRLVNTNFGKRDMWATLDYRHEHTPQDETQAYKDMKNYIRRLKRYIKKHGLPDLKYIYVTEWAENTETGKLHAHHHVVMNFPDRDKAEEIWGMGFRPQTRRLKPDDFGLTGLGNYIGKPETKTRTRQGKKRYGYSLNLEVPRQYVSDHKIKKRDVMMLSENHNEGKDFFENLYASYYKKSYKFIDMSIKKCDFHAAAYIYVRMRQQPVKKGVRKC